ncbi:MAG: hypothetical protein ACO280_00105 [Pseudohongiellaceae bacterium]|jgi:hypothetical protein
MFSRIAIFFACLGLSALLWAQTGHPAKGSWSGNLTSASGEVTRLRLLIDDHNGELSGAVNPGRNAVEMSKVTLDAATWTLTINAKMPEGDVVLTGKLSNLGSWLNRKYVGTYKQGSATGNFDFTIN